MSSLSPERECGFCPKRPSLVGLLHYFQISPTSPVFFFGVRYRASSSNEEGASESWRWTPIPYHAPNEENTPRRLLQQHRSQEEKQHSRLRDFDKNKWGGRHNFTCQLGLVITREAAQAAGFDQKGTTHFHVSSRPETTRRLQVTTTTNTTTLLGTSWKEDRTRHPKRGVKGARSFPLGGW